MKKMRFHTNVKILKIRGFNLIANFDNGSLIGLNNEGLSQVEYIYECGVDTGYLRQFCNEKHKELFNTLQKQKYFCAQNDDTIQAAYLHLTQRCNLHCLGCYSSDSNRNKIQDMTFDQICKIVDKLDLMQVKSLVISGGEPFLRRDIYDILAYIKECTNILSVQVITNGTLCGEYKFDLIKKYVDEMNVSIDGYSIENSVFIRDRGIFESVINTIKDYRKNNINTNIVVTIHRRNIDKIEKYFELAHELDTSINFSLLTCAGDFKDFDEWIPTEEQMILYGRDGFSGIGEKYEKVSATDFIVMARKSCGVGNGILSVAYDGTVYPCHMLHNPSLKMGNLLNDIEFEDIIRTKKKIRDMVSVENNEDCKYCEFAYVCGGGCRARSVSSMNSTIKKDSYCKMNYAYFDMIFKRLQASFNI